MMTPWQHWLLESLDGDLPPHTLPPCQPEPGAMLNWLVEQGLTGLAHALLSKTSGNDEKQRQLTESLRTKARHESVQAVVREQRMRELSDALGKAGIPALFIKGVGLAHLLYSKPHLRPRDDTDVLIAETDVAAATETIESLGFLRSVSVEGRDLMYEASFLSQDRYNTPLVVDLHWRVSNRPIFADRIGFQALLYRARPLAALGEHARTTGIIDSLLIAAMNRVAHFRRREQRLIQLYDVHLLMASLPPTAHDCLRERALELQIGAVCGHVLAETRRLFHSPGIRADLLRRLNSRASREASARYISFESGRVQALGQDLMALPDWSRRGRLLLDHLLPAAPYLRQKYPHAAQKSILLLRLRRLAEALAGQIQGRSAR